MLRENRLHAEALDRIALRGSTPLERLHWGLVTETADGGPEGEARLQQLYDLVESRDEEMQEQLISRFSFSREEIASALSPAEGCTLTSRPSWVDTLEQIVIEEQQALQSQDDPKKLWQDPCLQPGNTQPFEEFFLTFIRYGRKKLNMLISIESVPVSTTAQSTMEYWLLYRLFTLGGQVLYEEFTDVRLRHPCWEERCGADDSSRILYEEFLSQYQGEGLLSLFLEYSVLARYLVQQTEQWIEIVHEFYQRLADDYKEINTCFGSQELPFGDVATIMPGCSDPHQNGRTVFLLTFANKRKLLYKPHSLQIDASFNTLLEWINKQGLSPTLRGPGILSRPAYGWAEYIEHSGSKTLEDVHSYFQRAGYFLCLFYMLQSTDMHYENVIAHGDTPIPIDIETLVTPPIHSFWSQTAFPKLEWQQRDASVYSVYQSTMLPMRLSIQESSLDLSFLGCVSAFDSPYNIYVWKQINTDSMQQVSMPGKIPEAKNALFFNGALQNSASYIETILSGFQTMYRFIMSHRPALLTPDGPLAVFHACPGRYIARSTYLYEKQLSRLIQPYFLRDSTDGWIDVQIFLRPLLKHQASSQLWLVTEAEIAAIQRRDVPRFEIDSTSLDLSTDTGMRIENVFTVSALDHVQQCLRQFSEEDMVHQVTMIREAWFLPAEAREETLDREGVSVTVGSVEGE